MRWILKQYRIKLKHDKGVFSIRITAPNMKSAKALICAVEGCPPRAILSCTAIG